MSYEQTQTNEAIRTKRSKANLREGRNDDAAQAQRCEHNTGKSANSDRRSGRTKHGKSTNSDVAVTQRTENVLQRKEINKQRKIALKENCVKRGSIRRPSDRSVDDRLNGSTNRSIDGRRFDN